MNKTLDYYNKNAQSFIDGTVNVDFTNTQDRFIELLEKGSSILDFGCGSGRDTKYFLDKGFSVEAIDGSEELCKFASEYAGIPVKHMYFQELEEVNKYDGIWACSSILHLNRNDLILVLNKMSVALKDNGIIYTSFKYGEFEGDRNGRYFINLTESSFKEILDKVDNLEIEQQWITSDVRPGRDEEKWLNLLLRKK